MDMFKGFKPQLQDITVNNADNSDAEILPLEPDEEATTEEKSQVEVASESLLAQFQGARMTQLRKDIAAKHKRLRKMHASISKEGVTSFMQSMLMEEGVIDGGDTKILDDSAAADAKEAAKESTPDEIAEKGATQEELVKASKQCLKAQCRVLESLYRSLMKV